MEESSSFALGPWTQVSGAASQTLPELRQSLEVRGLGCIRAALGKAARAAGLGDLCPKIKLMMGMLIKPSLHTENFACIISFNLCSNPLRLLQSLTHFTSRCRRLREVKRLAQSHLANKWPARI